MGEEVADAHLPRDVAIVELEPREVVHHAVVPRQVPCVDERGQRRRGERLGVGRDGVERVLVHCPARALIAHAVSLLEYDAAVLHDGHGEAGNGPRLLGLGEVGVERGEVGSLLRGNESRKERRGEEQGGQAGTESAEGVGTGHREAAPWCGVHRK